ncbi:MAG: nickel pincer cofactor biosynthesis protein LarB [Deltaproteobacteria bacterium]|nr:nickel pincer cofactor biosynthesis protein LarB [Deltaproteobacteria bacterium]
MRSKELKAFVEYISHSALDIRRRERTGIIEAVYSEYKEPEVLLDIAKALIRRKAPLFFTRVNAEKADFILSHIDGLIYVPEAQIVYMPHKKRKRVGLVSVVSAGTSDRLFLEEACLTLNFLGNNYAKISDVGVAGVHRIIPYLKTLKRSSAVIVVAGMEGALPSLIGGIVNVPVIAVPTPIGYGVSYGGFAALLGMLSSCSPNVCAVNIGNGFGAACIASLINHKNYKRGK